MSPDANGLEDRLRLANARASVPWRLLIEKILTHLGVQARAPPRSPARGQALGLVPVAAILVAGIRLHFLDVPLHLRRHGPGLVHCTATLTKGQEMGWFEHGSTVIVLAPKGFAMAQGLHEGSRIKMGQALMRWQSHA